MKFVWDVSLGKGTFHANKMRLNSSCRVTCFWYCILHFDIIHYMPTTAATTVLQPFVWDYPGELVPEESLIH